MSKPDDSENEKILREAIEEVGGAEAQTLSLLEFKNGIERLLNKLTIKERVELFGENWKQESEDFFAQVRKMTYH